MKTVLRLCSPINGIISRPKLSLQWPITSSPLHPYQHRHTSSHPSPSPPRTFPTTGYELLNHIPKLEEESLPDYRAERFYPVHIGEVFNFRYQVITKLGFGSSSTVWLCRDYSQKYTRLIHDSFEIQGPHGIHPCILYQPSGMDICDYIQCLEGNALPEDLLRVTIRFMLIALDYLHSANVEELNEPAPRKHLPDNRTIYATRGMPFTTGEPMLADLGEARLLPTDTGTQTSGSIIMPGLYRAPEVMLNMEWDEKVDIWALGQTAWSLLQSNYLFTNTPQLTTQDDHARRFAEMIALLGHPPVEFLGRSEESRRFWDRDCNWKSHVEIPEESLDDRVTRLEGDRKRLFLRFLRKTLSWVPGERPRARELLMEDEWVRGEEY
ncbi:hypothetical protein AtubIFM55763_010192 [Aspergillus tubingensis]|uniref:non-specific serine/threonine protein kinase n=1 Tax=Aspergillus tubingensis TaxID=5068 RepID=A0A8H3SWV6_ASPTU|nr:kinase-like protein [Aspergillus tubingensis]GFN16360.1 kinase-like protein [Aspergillus tubingensis]GLA69675.1 hypothetical protein AtubIFM55763_010192 [Aspergillus tubingensis]GLA85924.1 hypothetical protein AtubIFM56815_010172 [Aspergillus tubingensis]